MVLICFEVIFSFIKTNSPPEFEVRSSRLCTLNPASENWFFGKVSSSFVSAMTITSTYSEIIPAKNHSGGYSCVGYSRAGCAILMPYNTVWESRSDPNRKQNDNGGNG